MKIYMKVDNDLNQWVWGMYYRSGGDERQLISGDNLKMEPSHVKSGSHVRSEIKKDIKYCSRNIGLRNGTQEYCEKNKYGLGIESGIGFWSYCV